MSQITGQKVPLAKLFGNEFFFTIPDYQRPYSWEKTHCEQLIDDLENANKEKEYFLGTVILQEIERIGHGRKYDLIDGQQRITTLQILLAVLRDLYTNQDYKKSTQELIYQAPNVMSNIPERVRLETVEKILFKDFIQTEGKTKDLTAAPNKNDSQNRIITAITTFRDRLSSYSQDKLEKLGQFISQKCIIVYVSTESFDDAYRLFVIINDRGLQLRRIDILKAQNLDPNVIKDEIERKEYAKKWENMECDLGSEKFEQLFFHIRTIELKDKANDDLLKEFTNLIFNRSKLTKGKDFIEYISEYKDIYEKLLLDQKVFVNNPKGRVAFNNLVTLMNDYIYSNEWIPSLLFFYKKFMETGLLSFIQKLENKFVADWVIGLSLGKRISNTYAILREIQNSVNVNDLLSSSVFDYDKNKFLTNISSPYFYSEPFCKYILAKLDYLIGENNVERRILASSIEHVLPQNPKDNSNWVKVFNVDDRNKWTNHISNLVLLSKRKNSSASNYDFDIKKEKYFKERISDLPSSMQILKYSIWDSKILEAREKDICKILVS